MFRLPEGRFHLTEACLYLTTAPKSNSTMAFFDALETVQQEREAEVPNHLRDASRDKDDFGHGLGYLYPHAYRDHWVAQQYLPQSLQGRVFYQPSAQGYEAAIQQQVARQREAQVAAMLEADMNGLDQPAPKGTPTSNRWLQRTLSGVGQELGQIRDKLFTLANITRHDLVLDLQVGTGLLAWEAVRRASVGGVWVVASQRETAQAFQQQTKQLEPLQQPVVLVCESIYELASKPVKELLLNPIEGEREFLSSLFEVVIGRNVLTHLADKAQAVSTIAQLLKPDGRVVLTEIVPHYTQRLNQLVDLSTLSAELVARIQQAEEAIYAQPLDPMVNWTDHDLAAIFEPTAWRDVQTIAETLTSDRQIGREQIARWFATAPIGQRLTFAQHLLAAGLTAEEVAHLRHLFEQQLAEQVVAWQSRVVYVTAIRK